MRKSPGKRSATAKAPRQVDKLANALRKVSPARLETLLAKRAVIQIRVSASDKTEMTLTAKRLGLTLTEYLTRLHYLVADRLARRHGI